MLDEIAETPISEIRHREPVRVRASTLLMSVVTMARAANRGAVIVEHENGTLAGIFTEADLAGRVIHTDMDWQEVPVREVMTTTIHTVEGKNSIGYALRVMINGRFRHLPIVDKRGSVLGIVSIRDILVHIAEQFPEEFLNLPADPDKEASSRWGG